jgi:hypothetical protein
MKKVSTYYFAVLAATNCLLGWIFIQFNRMMIEQFARDLGGRALPPATTWATNWPWWPYAFAVLFALGVCLSITSRIRSASLLHVIILGLAAEAFILFWTTVAYAIPYVSFVPEMIQ